MSETMCALCDTALPKHPILDGTQAFCCPGCHTVFNILSVQNQLANYQESPLFQQALKAGLISNPALLEQMRLQRVEIPETELERFHIEVTDMWCPSCAEVIRLILLQEKGVCQCVVDYATDLASITFSPRYLSKNQIIERIKSLGYQVASLDRENNHVATGLYMRFAVAAFCALNAMMFAYPLYATYFDYDEQGYGALFAWLSFASALPVIGYSAVPILQRFVTSLKVGIYGMETLVVLGGTAAFGLSLHELLQGGIHVYFDSLTVIIAFVLLGKIIESRAKFSAKNSLLYLAHAMPRRGRKRLPDRSLEFIPIKDIAPGDYVVAFAGEKVVLDGVVVEGSANCDESLMTGEPLPVSKSCGSNVLGGSIVQNGSLTFRVTSASTDSTLQKILNIVQKDIGHKTVYFRAADQIIRWFIPVVLIVAFGIALTCWVGGISDPGKSVAETAIIRAISVLLISCPCAIGIAAPLAEAHVMNKLAQAGVLVRNRGCLDLLGRETIFVFDKTGTVTEGRFSIMKGLSDLSIYEKRLLKAVAAQSTHPIACAIAAAVEGPVMALDRVEEHAGKGLCGFLGDNRLSLGSADFMHEQGIEIVRDQSPQGICSSVYFAYNGHLLARILLGDRIRPDIAEVVARLAPAKTVLLSGDDEEAVSAVGKACCFPTWRARCNPLQKRAYIEKLRKEGEIVCMIGDGINDAPALTMAHVGISVLSASDISMQVSDLFLTTDRLKVLPVIQAIARKGRRIIQQNLFWAFFYNGIGLALAAFGLLSPIFAAFAMMASSLIVLFNAQRI